MTANHQIWPETLVMAIYLKIFDINIDISRFIIYIGSIFLKIVFRYFIDMCFAITKKTFKNGQDDQIWP